MSRRQVGIIRSSFRFDSVVPSKAKYRFDIPATSASLAFRIYQILGTTPDVQMTFPAQNIAVPNVLVFTIVTTLTVLLVTWRLPASCSESWETCILDATEALPLIVLFYGNMFHKMSSKCKHFAFLRSLLPWSKSTKTELYLMIANCSNASFHFYLSFPEPWGPASVVFFSSYLLSAVISYLILIQFGSIVHELNKKFSRLIKKSRRLDIHYLSEQWDIFNAIDSINTVYGLTLMILSIWLSGKLVNNLYKAAQMAVFRKNIFLCIFLCISATVKFAVFFFAMHECEQTKLLVSSFLKSHHHYS